MAVFFSTFIAGRYDYKNRKMPNQSIGEEINKKSVMKLVPDSYIEIGGVDMLKKTILQIFPASLRNMFEIVASEGECVQEIRLRAGQPVIVVRQPKDTEASLEFFLSKEGKWDTNEKKAFVMSARDMEETLKHICNYSVYAYDEEIRQGYLTLQGGHRVGLAGQVVWEHDTVKTMKYINYMNIRVAHEIKDVSKPVLSFLYENGDFLNTLIVSPPGCGKTTMLRDIVRNVSNGNRYGKGCTVGLVDERSEIAGTYQGLPENDVGIRTDVLDACPKVYGMMLLIRALSPKVIAIDELGSSDDVKALELVMHCGSKILATIHGTDMESIITKRFMKEILKDKAFERYILLGKHNGKCIIEGIYDQDFRVFSDFSGYNRMWS